jgi:hypothetical protein
MRLHKNKQGAVGACLFLNFIRYNSLEIEMQVDAGIYIVEADAP